MKIYIKILTLMIVLFCTSCWAPRCPMDTCNVRMEHRHDDLVTGVFSGRYLYPPRLHFLWDKDKGEANPDTKFKGEGGRSKRKLRKKFPWERW
jgi:hypothetical protein